MLIHCKEGAHRAPFAAAAWLICKTGKPVEEVVTFLESLRCLVDIRGAMFNALQRHQDELSTLLRDDTGFLKWSALHSVIHERKLIFQLGRDSASGQAPASSGDAASGQVAASSGARAEAAGKPAQQPTDEPASSPKPKARPAARKPAQQPKKEPAEQPAEQSSSDKPAADTPAVQSSASGQVPTADTPAVQSLASRPAAPKPSVSFQETDTAQKSAEPAGQPAAHNQQQKEEPAEQSSVSDKPAADKPAVQSPASPPAEPLSASGQVRKGELSEEELPPDWSGSPCTEPEDPPAVQSGEPAPFRGAKSKAAAKPASRESANDVKEADEDEMSETIKKLKAEITAMQ